MVPTSLIIQCNDFQYFFFPIFSRFFLICFRFILNCFELFMTPPEPLSSVSKPTNHPQKVALNIDEFPSPQLSIEDVDVYQDEIKEFANTGDSVRLRSQTTELNVWGQNYD